MYYMHMVCHQKPEPGPKSQRLSELDPIRHGNPHQGQRPEADQGNGSEGRQRGRQPCDLATRRREFFHRETWGFKILLP